MPNQDQLEPDSKFSMGELLKLFFVLSLVFAVSAATGELYWTLICGGAVVGIFLAQHFATTRKLEFVLLLAPPVLSAALATIAVFLQDGRQNVTIGTILALGVIGALIGFIPSVMAIIAVNVFSACVYGISGIRLLKFEWNVAEETPLEEELDDNQPDDP